jgi:hypothetical protein
MFNTNLEQTSIVSLGSGSFHSFTAFFRTFPTGPTAASGRVQPVVLVATESVTIMPSFITVSIVFFAKTLLKDIRTRFLRVSSFQTFAFKRLLKMFWCSRIIGFLFVKKCRPFYTPASLLVSNQQRLRLKITNLIHVLLTCGHMVSPIFPLALSSTPSIRSPLTNQTISSISTS